MVSSVSAAYSNARSNTPIPPPSPAVNNSGSDVASDTQSAAPRDNVQLSSQAKAALAAQGAKVGPTDTSAESFDKVTADARAAIDAGYAQYKSATGENLSYLITASAKDVDKIYAQFDRRSLFAIASNSGGKFTADEQNAAQGVLNRQVNTAAGIATGADAAPGVPQGAPFDIHDQPRSWLAAIKFLDSASPEEKASPQWAYQRAWYENAYNANIQQEQGPPQNVTSDDPVVEALRNAIKSLTLNDPGVGGTQFKTWDDLKNAFHHDNADLNQAIAQRAAVEAQKARPAAGQNRLSISV
jgi:hypothetical protein